MDVILVAFVITFTCTLSTVSSEYCKNVTKFLAYTDCTQLLIYTIIGIPILRLDICSEFEATFTCTVTESMNLRWRIGFLSGVNIDRVQYSLGDQIGLGQYGTNQGTGVVYHFNLTSKSPLTSTMTTSTPTDLSGATVSCSNGLQGSANVATLALNGRYINASQVDTIVSY